jgi:hypothetical protein
MALAFGLLGGHRRRLVALHVTDVARVDPDDRSARASSPSTPSWWSSGCSATGWSPASGGARSSASAALAPRSATSP